MGWIAIVGPLINLALTALFKKCNPEETKGKTPQEYVRSGYNPQTDSFSKPLVKAAMKAVNQSISHHKQSLSRDERKRFPKPTTAEVREAAIAKLRETMNASPAQIRAVFSLADSVQFMGGEE